MKKQDALEIIRTMRETAHRDVANLQTRILELQEEYKQDPWPATQSQIARLQERAARTDRLAQALLVAEKEMS